MNLLSYHRSLIVAIPRFFRSPMSYITPNFAGLTQVLFQMTTTKVTIATLALMMIVPFNALVAVRSEAWTVQLTRSLRMT